MIRREHIKGCNKREDITKIIQKRWPEVICNMLDNILIMIYMIFEQQLKSNETSDFQAHCDISSLLFYGQNLFSSRLIKNSSRLYPEPAAFFYPWIPLHKFSKINHMNQTVQSISTGMQKWNVWLELHWIKS